MLATFRTDSVPQFNKERHVNEISSQKYTARHIFKSFIIEMDTNVRAAVEYDSGFLELGFLTDNDPSEERQLMKHVAMNYTMLTQIYHYMQCRSRAYPWIDNYTFREYFIDSMDILGTGGNFNLAKCDILMASLRYSPHWNSKVDSRFVERPHGISRFQFIEILLRISKLMYGTAESLTKE